MKMKLTTLLFGLLLAVGWTSNAFAQALPEGGWTKRMGIPSATLNAPAQAPNRVTGVSDVVHDKAYYQQFTYSWTGGDGVTHSNVDPTEPATDPYQMYELLRFVYTNRNFPGPYYSAYTPTYEREDPVYYGGISGGWDIPNGSTINSVGNITITTTRSGNTGNRRYIQIHSIAVYNQDGGNELVNWVAPANNIGNSLTAAGLTYNGTPTAGSANGTYYFYFNNATGSITIPSTKLNGATNVRVVINARYSNSGPTLSYTVNGTTTTQAVTGTFTDYPWNISGTSTNDVNYYKPIEDGYTVVLVALKDKAQMTLATEVWPANSSHFEQKSQLITYFQNNVEYVRLLTDGLRIGQGQGTGTVFNADGRLNRFFFLGKGQARKKAPRVQAFIDQGGNIIFQQFTANNQSYTTVNYQDWFGEDVPFEEMYEQFSPTSTTVSDESQTKDLFDKLREGNVYDVQHDCGSVTQAEHEFSLAGKDGTEHFPFSGLNFFVPDYRLLFWTTTFEGYTVDGRDNIPYERANTNYTQPEGSHGTYFDGVSDGSAYTRPTWYSAWSAYYAVYNKTYAPKVGIYRITLDAVATQVGTSHAAGNLNYNVTLTWVSSLNEMSGSIVPQTYTMYIIDENGNRTQLEPVGVKFYDINGTELNDENQNPFHVTQAVYAVPQNEHSYTIEYQVDGVADQGPAFHATSNRASVIIPGWNDFVGLVLDHHESDFVITKDQQTGQSSERHNWYRNFLALVNEDIVNGLTVSKITGAGDDGVVMNEFNLYRFLPDAQGNPTAETKVATITFDKETANTQQVKFNVTYYNQEIENYTLPDGTANAYSRAVLGIPESGYVRVKGNGDIVIWPNSYSVNIRSIRVYQNATGNQTVPNATWTAPNNLPTGWYVSPGSKWEEYTTEAGTQVGYMEGGGYIAIPNVLDTYPNARVVIEAFGEAGSISRITVNDHTENITATAAGTNYTWQTVSPNAAPSRAGETQIVTESFEDENVFPSFSLGGITDTQHTGAFGEWKIYDSTGAHTWGMSNISWNNMEEPQAWMPFNGTTVAQATPRTGNKYIESAAPWTTAYATSYNSQNGTDYTGADYADSWLISPVLSGNAQTISFYERIFSGNYTPETYEVRYSTTDNNPSSFTNVAASFESEATSWTLREANLPEGAKYFAIRHTSNSEMFGIMIDDVTYEIANEAPAAEGGLLRLHLLMADQLKTEIPDDNSHPDAYGYVLRWEQPANTADHRKSGTVRVNIQKTDCEVMGYYTLDQIDADNEIGINHDEGLTMDVLAADVEFDLSSSNDLLNYYNLQAEADQEPSFNEDYVTRLHRQEDFTYREMLETSPNLGEVYPSGEHHYYDDSEPIKTGYYNVGNRFMSYAPSVSTWGIQRRYYEYDGLDNTYGGPIWKTAVGKVEMNSDKKPIAERQTNASNSVNWADQGGAASLYILDNVSAIGYLPPETLTKVEFEPYMFRIFVESPSGKLRPYKTVDAGVDPNKPGEHLAPADGELTNDKMYGPICVWSGYMKRNADGDIIDDPENGVEVNYSTDKGPFTYTKMKVDRTGGSNANPLGEWDKDANNAMFGALDALVTTGEGNNVMISDEDLKIFVRFYFCVKGEAAGHTVLRGEGSRSGNGAESGGSAAGQATSVSEIQFLGEIVSTTYYNAQGMVSDQPFDGVNIVVTRFSDGATSISKVVR